MPGQQTVTTHFSNEQLRSAGLARQSTWEGINTGINIYIYTLLRVAAVLRVTCNLTDGFF